MNQETKQNSHVGGFWAFVFAIGLAVVAYLYYQETQKSPEEKIKEVVKEVPVEKIKEVIKEVQVEVPAELDKSQQLAINIAERWLSAPRVADSDEVFYGIKSFKTKVTLNDAVKKIVSEDSLRNKLELTLKRNGISIDPESPYSLIFNVSGFWDLEETRFIYSCKLQLLEMVTLYRNHDFRNTAIYTWKKGRFGQAGKAIVEKRVLENVESYAKEFSIKYLKVMDKEKRKIEQINATKRGFAAAPSL